MHKCSMLFLLSFAIAVCAQSPASTRQERQPLTRVDPENAAKAQELMAQTRAALSQSAKLDDLKTLSVNGKIRRLTHTASGSPTNFVSVNGVGMDLDPTIIGAQNIQERFREGKVEYDFALPDKFSWQEDMERAQVAGFFAGEQYGQKSPFGPYALHHPMPNPRQAEAMRQYLHGQYAPITLGLLLLPPPGAQLEFSYAGEKPFRQTSAEVITITGAGTFKADLYLDQKTHLPLLLRFVVGGMMRPAMVMTPAGTSREEALRQLEIAKQQAAAKPPGQQEREKLILFEDYRAEDGVLFPHKITTQINGKLIEEISFTKFKLNHPVKPENFSEKQ
ncbi:MAG TPA: hypothetical protein VFZ34_05825 [Blastocatellia bacterium]|nr:hypothetical protein [Blastocatellia bacterium]